MISTFVDDNKISRMESSEHVLFWMWKVLCLGKKTAGKATLIVASKNPISIQKVKS